MCLKYSEVSGESGLPEGPAIHGERAMLDTLVQSSGFSGGGCGNEKRQEVFRARMMVVGVGKCAPVCKSLALVTVENLVQTIDEGRNMRVCRRIPLR